MLNWTAAKIYSEIFSSSIPSLRRIPPSAEWVENLAFSTMVTEAADYTDFQWIFSQAKITLVTANLGGDRLVLEIFLDFYRNWRHR